MLASAVLLVKEYYEKLKEISILENAIVVRYEDLLMDTETELLKIYEQLHLNTSELKDIISENSKTSKIAIKGVFRSGKKDGFIDEMNPETLNQLEKELTSEIEFYGAFSLGN